MRKQKPGVAANETPVPGLTPPSRRHRKTTMAKPRKSSNLFRRIFRNGRRHAAQQQLHHQDDAVLTNKENMPTGKSSKSTKTRSKGKAEEQQRQEEAFQFVASNGDERFFGTVTLSDKPNVLGLTENLLDASTLVQQERNSTDSSVKSPSTLNASDSKTKTPKQATNDEQNVHSMPQDDDHDMTSNADDTHVPQPPLHQAPSIRLPPRLVMPDIEDDSRTQSSSGSDLWEEVPTTAHIDPLTSVPPDHDSAMEINSNVIEPVVVPRERLSHADARHPSHDTPDTSGNVEDNTTPSMKPEDDRNNVQPTLTTSNANASSVLSPLVVGSRVQVTSINENGLQGVVESVVNKNLYEVRFENVVIKKVRFESVVLKKVRKSLRILDNHTPAPPLSSPAAVPSDPAGASTRTAENSQRSKTPISQSAVPPGSTALSRGTRVRVKSVAHKNWEGIVERVDPANRRRYYVRFPKKGNCVKRKDITSLIVLEQSLALASAEHQMERNVTMATRTTAPGSTRRNARPTQSTTSVAAEAISGNCSLQVGQEVKVVTGNYVGERGIVAHLTEHKVKLSTVENPLFKTSVRPIDEHDAQNDKMKIAGFDYGGEMLGNSYIVEIVTSKTKPKQGNTIMSYLFGDRLRIRQCEVNSSDDETSIDATSVIGKKLYQLVATRSHKEETKNFFTARLKRIDCYEVLVDAPGTRVESIDIEKELACLANFSALSTFKLAARLKLLTSPVVKLKSGEYAISCQKTSVFKFVPNADHFEGCGFISESMLQKLVPCRKLDSLNGIQVRCVVPRLGLFKGMLQRKRKMDGDHHIELNSSMLKAGPSVYNNLQAWGCVAITRIVSSQTNLWIGKFLDPFVDWTPTKTFKNKIKPVSDMILPFWKHMGLPQEEIKKYVRDAMKPSGLRHAWAMGMADPTDSLPAGHVFVTGFKGTVSLDKIFITRSPCREDKDGRMLPLVTTRPTSMSQEDWDWLNSLPFGSVMFANPRPGMRSLPPLIADGDLDGDLYFISWDSKILSYLAADPVVEEPVRASDVETIPETTSENWFARGQEALIHNALIEDDLCHLQGKLYRLSEKLAQVSELGVADPDANAYGKAFKQVLDYPKHRRPIELDGRLVHDVPEGLTKKDRIPPRLHKYLSITDESKN